MRKVDKSQCPVNNKPFSKKLKNSNSRYSNRQSKSDNWKFWRKRKEWKVYKLMI